MQTKPLLKSNEKVKLITTGPLNSLIALIGESLYHIEMNSGIRVKIADVPLEGNEPRSLQYDSFYNGVFLTITLQGAYFIHFKTGRVFKFPIINYPDLRSCHYILKDQNGDLWMPTNSGLYFMRKKVFEDFIHGHNNFVSFSRLGKSDGLDNEEFNGGFTNGGISEGDSLFFSTMSGIVTMSAEEVKKKIDEGIGGKILITNILLDDSLTVARDGMITAKPDFKRLSILLDFPFSKIPGASLEYRLEGFTDTAWIPVPENNLVLLRGLSSGRDYTLNVKVKDHPEVEVVTLKIKVMQFWYRTTIAYILYVLLFMLGLYTFLDLRIKTAKNKALKEIDESRKQLFAIISHDLRSPLKSYQGLADSISYLLKKGDFERIMSVAAQIDTTGIKIDLLLQNLLNWNLLQQEETYIRDFEVNLYEVVAELLPVYADIAGFRDIVIEFNSKNDNVLVRGDASFLSLLVRNLVDNAIKNAPPKTQINIGIHTVANKAELTIQNIITESQNKKLSNIKQMLENNIDWEPGQIGMGLGLKMVKLAVKKCSGDLAIELGEQTVTWVVRFII